MEFVKEGGSVCIIARNKKDLDKTAGELVKRQDQRRASPLNSIACDATDMKKLQPLIEALSKKTASRTT